ncbi:hypothetical protein COB11_06295 [Candidatus Aerophobetes bacterium]|uniref:Uncharacterized protein n=1 Tax=Aerophobetes bacterium TaxID=2030807 RepID=A0A2A4YDK6_UNCAE|nr:MAG: hypothetical protein COB11_06295 [Candidatus Aerophobetes bacterium]
MTIKNFKSHKNYRKRVPPTQVQILDKEGKRKMKFDKSKLPAMICKIGSMAVFALGGYFAGNLPGVMIGAIIGHQVGKFILKHIEKKPKKKSRRY